jgi:hypothetical protein
LGDKKVIGEENGMMRIGEEKSYNNDARGRARQGQDTMGKAWRHISKLTSNVFPEDLAPQTFLAFQLLFFPRLSVNPSDGQEKYVNLSQPDVPPLTCGIL